MEILGQLWVWENSSLQGSDALLLTTVIWWKANERFYYLSHLAGHRGGPQRGNSSTASQQECPHMQAGQPRGARVSNAGAGPTSPELDTEKKKALKPEPTTSASLS